MLFISKAWVGDPPEDLEAQLFVDADFAGCPYTLRSSNGLHFDIQGPNSSFPLSAEPSGQTVTAQSSSSAETCSMATGIRSKGDPALSMLALILGKYHRVGDGTCGGPTLHRQDKLFMDLSRLGYQDGNGP